jgi:hypothetical protein
MRCHEGRTIAADVRLLAQRSFYARSGDLFAYLCLAYSVALLLVAPSIRPARKRATDGRGA